MHARGVVEVFVGAEAYQAVVGFGMILLHKVHVVGGDNFRVGFTGEFQQHLVYFFLTFIRSGFAPRLVGSMTLQLNVKVIAE